MAEATGRPAGVVRLVPAILSAAVATWFATFIPEVAGGARPEFVVPWAPSFGFEFALLLDGLGLLFALLVTGVGALILLYTSEYFRSSPRMWEILALLGLFEIAMLGLVLADDAATLYLFWEGTTVTSFLLIGFDHEKSAARRNAIQALLVTGMGGLALLAALLLMGNAAGTYRISEMGEMVGPLRELGLYVPVFVLVMLGCFTKSAQIPFHFWLPNAMAAPTPVSAYLHSATMVKAGVYLLARLTPNLGGTELWSTTLIVFGAATMLLSSVWALRQTDLKLALAFTTVMGLGTLVLFLGVGTEAAVIGMVTFLVVHAFYKASLFLVVGILDKMAGSREASKLSGLGRAMPFAWAAAALPAASMAGLPPFLGFIGKEELYGAATYEGGWLWSVALIALIANAMMIAIAGAVALSPFVGDRRSPKAEPKDAPLAMWLGAAPLGVLGLLLGFFPGWIDEAIIAPTASAILGRPVAVHLYLWHGFNASLVLSLVTFALGVALFLALPRIRRLLAAAESGSGGRPPLPAFEWGYDRVLWALDRLSAATVRTLQPGLMSRYLRLLMGALAAVLVAGLLAGGAIPSFEMETPEPLGVVAVILVAAGSAVLPFTANRLLMITALGVAGAGVALTFAIYGAIDVAITQLMVETLVVVIIAVALLKLPRLTVANTPAARAGRAVSAVIACVIGVGTMLAVLHVMATPLDMSLTRYFEEASAPLAHGHNIVNVILVDFRGLDTFGEIAVVAIAGISALALLAAPVRALKDRHE